MQPDRHLLMRVEHARVEELRLLDEQLATRRPTHVGIRLDLGEHVDAADKRQPDVLEEPIVRDEEEEELRVCGGRSRGTPFDHQEDELIHSKLV